MISVDESGQYCWSVPPLKAWDETKVTLAGHALATSEELANNPANIGRSVNLWGNAFMTIYVYSLESRLGGR